MSIRRSHTETALWLASWYPSKIAPFDGDFIQRHARATALVQPVQVVHVVKDAQGAVCSRLLIEEKREGGLRETIIYYKPRTTGCKPLDQLISTLTYYSIFRRYLRDHVSKGKPFIVHLHVVMRAGLLALWLKKKWGIPYVITEHWTGYQPQADENFFQKNVLFRSVVKRVLKGSDRLLPVSRQLGDAIAQTVQAVPYTVVYNVADTAVFHYEGSKPPLFRFVHVSSMNDQKNVPGILRVLKNLLAYGDWECRMIGPAGDVLKNYSEALGLAEKVEWMGELSYPGVAEQVRQASAFVLFSRYENLPCVLVEALCCGVPVIAPRTGGIPEIVPQHAGLLIEPGSEEALLQAMRNMMENYGRYNRRGISEWATGMFNYKKIGQEIADIYKSVLVL